MTPPVETLQPRQVAAFIAHIRKHLAENGRHGMIYAPFGPDDLQEDHSTWRRRMEAWHQGLIRDLSLPEWRRAFVVRDPNLTPAEREARDDDGIIAHLDLRGGSLQAELHRCNLAMGMYESFRGQGIGRALLQHAVAWVRDQTGVRWIDLGVFSHNLAAQHLYRQVGFAETGRTPDRFRVMNASIDDVQMALRIARD